MKRFGRRGRRVRISLLASVAGLSAIAYSQTNGVWTQTATGGSWSNAANWQGGAIADGAGAIADFSTLDLPEGQTEVVLDGDRSVGSLRFADTNGTASPGAWLLSGAATLTLTGSPLIFTEADTSFGADLILAAPAGFAKSGAAVLTLANGAAQIGGDVTVTGGGLAIAAGAIGAGEVLLQGNGVLSLLGGTSAFHATNIRLAGGAQAVLSSNASWSGFLSGPADATVDVTGNISFGSTSRTQQLGEFLGTVNIPSDSSIRVSATQGNANNNGGANATFHVDGSIYTRNLAHQEGIVLGALSGSGTLQGQTNTVIGTVIYRVGAKSIDTTFAGTFVNGANGTTGLVKEGTGTLTLTGDSTATGALSVEAGVLEIGDGSAAGGAVAFPTLAIAEGASLVLQPGQQQEIAGVISGEGRLVKSGGGTTVLSASEGNLHTAGTEITGGTLSISQDHQLGEASGAVRFPSGQGVLASSVEGLHVARSIEIAEGAVGGLGALGTGSSLVVDGVISGAGRLAIQGEGFVALTQANDFAGGVLLHSGTLLLASESGAATGNGAVEIQGGALAGEGSVPGAVEVAAGGALRPGVYGSVQSEIGTLTLGSLHVEGGATLYYDFSTTAHDGIELLGALSASATASEPVLVDLRHENTQGRWTLNGSYPLIRFQEAFAGDPSELFQVTPESAHPGRTYTFSVVDNELVLTISGTEPSSWNGTSGGAWSDAGNWLNGVPNAGGANVSLSEVGGGAQTLTLDVSARVGELTILSDARYTIEGPGSLIFDNLENPAQFNILTGEHWITAPVEIPANGLELLVAGEGRIVFDGEVSGSGEIVKFGPGAVVLNGDNDSLTGNLDFTGGSLTFREGGLGSGDLTLDETTLIWDAGNTEDITVDRTITFGLQDVAFSVTDEVLLTQPFGGGSDAGLIKRGSGILALASPVGYSGLTTIEEGTLRLAEGGTLPGSVDNLARLQWAWDSDADFVTDVSGSGDFHHDGGGDLTYAVPSTFSGTTTITGTGRLILGDPRALQYSVLEYNQGDGQTGTQGELSFGSLTEAALGSLGGSRDLLLDNESGFGVELTVGGGDASGSYSGALEGYGSLIKAGAGTLRLQGASTLDGAVTARGGVLEVGEEGDLYTFSLEIGEGGTYSNWGATYIDGLATVSNANGAATLLVQDGVTEFAFGLSAVRNQNYPYLIQVNGGELITPSISLARSNYVVQSEPAAGSTTHGLYVNGGSVHVTGNLDIGTQEGLAVPSSVSTRIDAGTLLVDGVASVGLGSTQRWSVLDVNGGSLVVNDTASGLLVGGPSSGFAAFLVRAGVAEVERIQLGQAENVGASVVRVSGSGALYVGAGGIAIGATQVGTDPAASFVPAVSLGSSEQGSVLAAKADWSSSVPLELRGIATIQAADAAGTGFDIALGGAVGGAGSLVKTGSGTVTIGQPGYAGATRVEAGRLQLGAAGLADNAAVILAEGAVLELAYSGTDDIGSLVIGSQTYTEAGTYGGIGSGADVELAAITGAGRLRLGDSASVSPFLTWAAQYGLTGENSGPFDDFDGDGRPNLLEFALDGDPASSAADGKVRTALAEVEEGQALVLTLPVRDGSGAAVSFTGSPSLTATADEVVYQIEGSNDLVTYDQAVEEIVPALSEGLPALNAGWSYRSFRLVGAVAERGAKGFLRAVVSEEGS